MTQPEQAKDTGGKNEKMLLGKLLLTFTIVSVAMGPLTADLNNTHIFNPDWPPHARFHNAVGLFSSIGFALLGLWLLWKKTTEFRTNLLAATAIPIFLWSTFFLALLIPGTAVEDHLGTLPVILGLPLNLLVALMFTILSITGYILCNNAHEKS